MYAKKHERATYHIIRWQAWFLSLLAQHGWEKHWNQIFPILLVSMLIYHSLCHSVFMKIPFYLALNHPEGVLKPLS